MHNTRTQGLASASMGHVALTALWNEGVIQESHADVYPAHTDSVDKQWQRIEDAFNFHGNVVGRIWHGVQKMADSIAERACAAGLCEVVLPRHYMVLVVGQTPYLFKCDRANQPRFALASGTSSDAPWPGEAGPMNSTEMCEAARDMADGWLNDLAAFLEQRCALIESLDSLLALETSADSLPTAPLLESLPNCLDTKVAVKPVLPVDGASQTSKRRKALSELGRSTRDAQEAGDAGPEQRSRRMTLGDLGRSRDGRVATMEEPERRVAAG